MYTAWVRLSGALRKGRFFIGAIADLLLGYAKIEVSIADKPEMNYLQIIGIATQIANVIQGLPSEVRRKFGKGDALLYIAARELTKQLELRNPDIWTATGYANRIDPGSNF